jgi:dTDP-4-dehydrorhamnose 3,5-epimerase
MSEPLLLSVNSYSDNRGMFYESYTPDLISNVNFVQDCHSISHKNVIRGMHYQWDKPLSKLVRVSCGSIMDVLVDIRSTSKNYGKVYYYMLNSTNLNQLWVPAGFAHGFISLEDNTHVQYKFDQRYNKNGEGAINPFDSELNIKWNASNDGVVVSEKDKSSSSFSEYKQNPKF